MNILIIIIFVITGTLLGTATGLTPGLHVNNVALLALMFYQTGANPLYLSALVVSAVIAHTFLDFIPSTFLGAPEADTALSVLPMHRLLLSGRGFKAVYLSAVGSALAMLIALPLIVFIFLFLSFVTYSSLKYYIPVILITIILFLLYEESKKSIGSMLTALYIFIISGAFGWLVFHLPQNDNFFPISFHTELLFPMFTGLFGIPTLILSKNASIPPQKIEKMSMEKSNFLSSLYGTVSGALVGFLPGITSGIASVIARGMYGSDETEEFIVTLGSVNTANALFNLAALFIIMHPRSRAVGVISNMVKVTPWVCFLHPPVIFIILLIAAFISATLSFFLTVELGKFFTKITEKLGERYGHLSMGILITLVIITFLITGVLGLIILVIGSAIGLLPPKLGVMRVHLMACILLPVLIFYLS